MRLKDDVLGMERHIVLTKDELKYMEDDLHKSSELSFDTETTGLDYFTSKLVGLSMANGKKGWYIPVGHTTGKQLPIHTVLDTVKPILENEKIPKIAQNMKFDYQTLLKVTGIEVKGQWLDTMIAGWLLNENTRNGLKQLCKQYLKYQMTEFHEVAGKKARFQDADILEAGKYGVDDSIVTYRLMELFAPRLAQQGLDKVFFKVEMPFIKVIADMEIEGTPVDVNYLEEKGKWAEGELLKIRQDFFEMIGRPINLNSPKQLAQVLFDELKMPIIQKTPTGNPSTAGSVLNALARKGYKEAQGLARYKKLMKIKSTYIDGLIGKVREDGRLHGSFNQTGTVTGRLSSSKPNMQNMPSRDNETEIKRAFIAPEGYDLLNADYSQIELRIMAHFSKDPAMMDAYEHGQDLHCRTASLLSNEPYEDFILAKEKESRDEELTKRDKYLLNQRQLSKSVNFGIIYGMGAKSLAGGEGITEKEAQDFINQYLNGFKGVDKFIRMTHAILERDGFIKTLTGRRRRLPWIYNDNFSDSGKAKRQAVNSKIQGSAGDLMKIAMNKLYYEVLPKYNAKLINQVHDEILILSPKEYSEECRDAVKETMINTVKLRVPLDADIKICKTWADGH